MQVMEKESLEKRKWGKPHKIQKKRILDFLTLSFRVYMNFKLDSDINQKILW